LKIKPGAGLSITGSAFELRHKRGGVYIEIIALNIYMATNYVNHNNYLDNDVLKKYKKNLKKIIYIEIIALNI
jgi:hypothetical protein